MNKPITPEEMTAYIEATWNKCQEKAWQEPKREWVGLTKEDMPVGNNPAFDTDEFALGAAWAEAILKEKNA